MSDPESPAVGKTDGERAAFFEELMREERARDTRDRRRSLVFVRLAAFAVWVVVVLLVSTGGPWGRRSVAEVSGLDLKVGECFDAPALSGEAYVNLLSCADRHTGEVFADFSVPDGPYPGTVELYDASIARCRTLAGQGGATAVMWSGRVQVMTPTSSSWQARTPHRIVCYVHFLDQVSKPI